jgi:hypothetical protein
VTNRSYVWYQRFDTVRLKCPLLGRPDPDITWYFNRTLIKPHLNEVFQVGTDGTLRILELDENLQGLYHCNGKRLFVFAILKKRHYFEL